MVVRIFLKILSKLYYIIVELRNFLYTKGIFKSHKLNARVISIGNVTWGGSGKTSFVSFLTKNLTEKKSKTAILTRGYKRKGKKTITLEPGTKDIDWQKIGDEAYLLASHCSHVPVIIGKDRVLSGKKAIAKYSSDFLILDDGFQHRKLRRDLDVVMIDAQDPFGNGQLIPAGKLREPIKNIKRADMLVLNRAQDANDKEKLIRKLRKYNLRAPIMETEYLVKKIYNLKKGEVSILPAEIKDKNILGFCGIGNPQSFKKTLQYLNVRISDFIVFPDHHTYKEKDLRKIEKRAFSQNVDLILTTEKDKMRLSTATDFRVPTYIVRIESRIITGEEKLWDMIYEWGIDKN